jgi:hypothetical protein
MYYQLAKVSPLSAVIDSESSRCVAGWLDQEMIADSVVDSEDGEQLQRALALSLEVDDFVSLAGGRVFVFDGCADAGSQTDNWSRHSEIKI